MKRQKRFEELEKRPIHQDTFVKEWPEEGFVAMMGPNDPKPSVKVENGKIVEMDGKKREDFDLIDLYIAKYGINVDNVEKVINMDSTKIARMLVDPNVSRESIIEITSALTPAKAEEIISKLDFGEMIMAIKKMRPRRKPDNQCHVTNTVDNPVQIAADAADAALRGFPEQETTTAVARYAPFNAISILIGAQTGRPGVLTQCSVEEATELQLGMRGFTAYAETISVYGTDRVFTDGDDTPWSKGFLASCYASRGLKMRFTSGAGSEVLMGYPEGKSMLYLEARCILLTKASGVQGLQNGAVSCIEIPGAVPNGIREVLGENLLCMMCDIECASGCDQAYSHSDMRRTERFIGQFIAGTDYINSGYSSTPNYDNTFAGSNTDAMDYDDMYVMERDLGQYYGIHPVQEETIIKARNKAAKALQAVFEDLGLPKITDEEVEAATYANTHDDMPKRDMVADMKAAQDMMDRGITAVDIIKALYNHGFKDVAEAVLNLQKQKVVGDYLQTSSIFDKNWNITSAVNDGNDYQGPGTGYRLYEDKEEWDRIKDLPFALDPEHLEL
ncbi:propanediol/glycerol family dehydratase large subunit [Limosilactobacillus sp. RRLNB_1_1]|uniref:Propanediol/glycerol family dehydratase large subunit n=2 Tax=Limosilactobacillus TaxID=2742598 RepID=A0A7W3TS16_9LACO|nr:MULTISPECIES: propanediol/glycerol family dehydratase large subunit [Limosilactobacillus]MRH45352.1 propanediol/glycerol family dehydratase large subunit [Limosilactobacillus reuteri]MBB1069541.1 propanediol/glycerol family dehydratase large subunit [Limosilactobacillus albertensis]MBB1123121.1 propanediol/glycerol family dehydratase large subunit [Limosilactobacillus albertensis]MCD7118067.1 propanediol/glycerol family dehydratase large subunit [Limosilactobacillus albertensis]MCD7122305.1